MIEKQNGIMNPDAVFLMLDTHNRNVAGVQSGIYKSIMGAQFG